MFMTCIKNYLENTDNKAAYEVIKEDISRNSEFAGFKRQIIRNKIKSGNILLQAFEEALL